VSVGEADLRRMKRQFSSLKNTFLHYEVKDEFIAALADGLPNGTEEIQLQQFEEEAERTVSQLREWKAKNVSRQEEIASVIDEVDRMMLEVSEESSKALEDLRAVFGEMAEFEAFEREAAVDIEPGMDELACQRVIEEESRRATELESRLIASMDELKSLEDKLPSSRDQVDMMREELRSLEDAVRAAETEKLTIEDKQKESTARTMKLMAEEGRKVAQQRAWAKASAWAAESMVVLQSISGISDVSMDGHTLRLRSNIVYPIKPMSKGEALVAATTATVVYTMELEMDKDTGYVVGGLVAPEVAGCGDLVGEVVGEISKMNRSATVEHVLGELRTRLGAHHHRVALIDARLGAPGAVAAIETLADDAKSLTCDLVRASGGDHVRVKLAMTGCWPEEDDRFDVVDGLGGVELASAVGEAALVDLRRVGLHV
jgi:hypothetical protein